MKKNTTVALLRFAKRRKRFTLSQALQAGHTTFDIWNARQTGLVKRVSRKYRRPATFIYTG